MLNWGEIVELLLQANPVVQGVMILLFVLSLMTWGIVFFKTFLFSSFSSKMHIFFYHFSQLIKLSDFYEEILTAKGSETEMSELFVEGYHAHQKILKHRMPSGMHIKFVKKSMTLMKDQMIAQLEKYINFLATMASVSPYIGLFGTVWGVMHAFSGISLESASINQIAPGIIEALVATAMGLFVAIPASIGYNRSAQSINEINMVLDIFIDELLQLITLELYPIDDKEVDKGFNEQVNEDSMDAKGDDFDFTEDS